MNVLYSLFFALLTTSHKGSYQQRRDAFLALFALFTTAARQSSHQQRRDTFLIFLALFAATTRQSSEKEREDAFFALFALFPATARQSSYQKRSDALFTLFAACYHTRQKQRQYFRAFFLSLSSPLGFSCRYCHDKISFQDLCYMYSIIFCFVTVTCPMSRTVETLGMFPKRWSEELRTSFICTLFISIESN